MRTVRHMVREAREEDLEALNALYNGYVRTSHVTFDLEATNIIWRRRWFDEHQAGPHRIVVALIDGGVAGYACSSRYRPRAAYDTTVETSVYVDPGSQGRGVGKALYRELFGLLAAEPVHRAVAAIAQPNDASVLLHRKFSFALVGRFTEQGRKFGRFWDVDWYERGFERTSDAP